jgi:Fe2+ transport system protein B
VRWLALKLLERDGWATAKTVDSGVMTAEEIESTVSDLDARLGDSADVVLAEGRYRFIEDLAKKTLKRPVARRRGATRPTRSF